MLAPTQHARYAPRPSPEHRRQLLIAIVEAAIARGCRHYSEKGELLATTLAVLECLQREGFVTVEAPARRRSTPAPGTP